MGREELSNRFSQARLDEIEEEAQRRIACFGRSLMKLREREGLTQAQLAEVLRVSQTFIHMLEVGRRLPSVNLCLRLALIFEVSMDDLFEC